MEKRFMTSLEEINARLLGISTIPRATFSICLKMNFVKPQKISTHSAHSEIVISILSIGCLIVRLHEILFQTDAENFSFLSYKTKKFCS